jgi:hypothetical protein
MYGFVFPHSEFGSIKVWAVRLSVLHTYLQTSGSFMDPTDQDHISFVRNKKERVFHLPEGPDTSSLLQFGPYHSYTNLSTTLTCVDVVDKNADVRR